MKVEFFIGVALLVLFLLGAGIGTVTSIRASRGPRERRFVIRECLAAWSLFTTFLVAVVVLPSPYRWIAGAVFLVLIPAMIYRWTTQHQLIRILDARETSAQKEADAAPVVAPQRPG